MMGPHLNYKGNRISPMQMAILVTVRKESMYGYNILKSLRDRFEGVWEPKTGAVYPAIKRLQEHGLLVSEMLDEKEHYSLSDDGQAWLRETIEMVGSKASMGMKFMSMIQETYEDMGFQPTVCFSDHPPRDERLAMLKRMREGVEFDLRTINDMIERLERDEEWEA